MGTTNKFQERIKQANHIALLDNIEYFPKMTGLGKTPTGWSPVIYANQSTQILKANFVNSQLDIPNGLMDNVFPRGGITYTTETVLVQPTFLEFVESEFIEKNIQEVIPGILTEMYRVWDKKCAEALLAESVAITAEHDYKCAPEFMDVIWREVLQYPMDTIKHVVVSKQIYEALTCVIHYSESKMWWDVLSEKLAKARTTLRVCDLNSFLAVTTAKSSCYFITEEASLAEYTGIIPKYYASGVRDDRYETWVHFAFSNTNWRRRNSSGVKYGKVKNMDPTKFGEKACPA